MFMFFSVDLKGHFFDVMVMYGSLLRHLLDAGFPVTDTAQVANFTQNRFTFFSPVNGQITLDENGDRRSDYVIGKFSKATNRFEVPNCCGHPFLNLFRRKSYTTLSSHGKDVA